MQQFYFGPKGIFNLGKAKERRRRSRRSREDERRKRIDLLRRRIEAARKRRQRLLLILLLALLAALEIPRFTFPRRHDDWPELDAGAAQPQRPTTQNGSDAAAMEWTPDPDDDFRPAPGEDDFCDGYSRSQWTRMFNQRRTGPSRQDKLKMDWETDPTWKLFPERYQHWGHRPYLGQIMEELKVPYWTLDALAALKLMSPLETHVYIDEAYTTDFADLMRCNAPLGDQIIANLKSAAVRWEARKRREAEELARAIRFSPNDDGPQR